MPRRSKREHMKAGMYVARRFPGVEYLTHGCYVPESQKAIFQRSIMEALTAMRIWIPRHPDQTQWRSRGLLEEAITDL